MAKWKVFMTRIVPPAAGAMLQPMVDLEIWQGQLPPAYPLLLEKTRGMDGIYTLLTDRIDSNLIGNAGSQLKVISQMAVGFDNIDVAAATAAGIPVGNTPGVLTETTADFAWALLMAAARRVVEGDKFTHAGNWKTWEPMGLTGPDVHSATLGLLGFGRIGQAVARRAGGFGMKILYHDIKRDQQVEQELHAESVDLQTLLRESDFISIHTTLNEDTQHLFNDERFGWMKPTAILINTARGPIIDQTALFKALENGKIAGAALDVTEKEPIEPDNPLMQLENCIICPHIASASIQTRTRMATMAAENLLAGLKGERLPNCVNPQIYAGG
jgi:glyoxylate reductase